MRERSTRPDRKYAAIPNAMLRNESLSIEARGLLALLMTYADDWVFRRDHLMRITGMKKDKFTRVMGELVEAGYVERTQTRDESGRLLGRSWIIRDEPTTEVRKNRTMDTEVRKNRSPAEPLSGKSVHIRKPTGKKTNSKNASGSDEPALFSEIEEPEPQEDPVEIGFERFWKEVWPSHHRKAQKVDCAKVYRQACEGKHGKADRAVTPDELNAAAARYIASVDDRQFLKGPLPWLRGALWEPWLGADDPKQSSGRNEDWMERVT